MALITVDEARQHIQTDLVNDALQRLIDDADAEIIRRLGDSASQVEILEGGGRLVFLNRQAGSITEIKERYAVDYGAPTEVDLETNDFLLYADGHRIERLRDGDNPASAWRGVVTVTAVPLDMAASLIRLEIDLVKLAVRYEAMRSQSVGDVSISYVADYQAERNSLFSGLGDAGRLPFV